MACRIWRPVLENMVPGVRLDRSACDPRHVENLVLFATPVRVDPCRLRCEPKGGSSTASSGRGRKRTTHHTERIAATLARPGVREDPGRYSGRPFGAVIRRLWCHAQQLHELWRLESMPSALRDDDERAGGEARRLLPLIREEEDRRKTLDDHNDLVADGVALPFAVPGPMSDEDATISVFAELTETTGLSRRCGRSRSIGEKGQRLERAVYRDRIRSTLRHVVQNARAGSVTPSAQTAPNDAEGLRPLRSVSGASGPGERCPTRH